MDSSLVPSSASTSKWGSTAEGKWGKVVGTILGILGLVGFYFLLPTLIALALNTIYLVILGVVAFVLIYLILDKDIQTMAFYTYKSLIRLLRVALINTDPVGIIENYIADIKKQYQKLELKVQELSGAKTKLSDATERDKEELTNQMDLATVGKKKGLSQAEISVYTNQAGRLESRIRGYQALLVKLNTAHKMLEDIRKACKVIIADKTNQVADIKIRRETMNIGFSAFKSAISILKGDPDKKYFYDEAIESIQNDISMKTGIIEQYLNESSEILQSVNLQNASFEEKGARLLEKWEANGMAELLSNGTPAQERVAIPANYSVVDTPNSQVPSNNKYKNLL